MKRVDKVGDYTDNPLQNDHHRRNQQDKVNLLSGRWQRLLKVPHRLAVLLLAVLCLSPGLLT